MKTKQNTVGLVLLIGTTLALGYCAKKKEDPTNTGDPVTNAEAVSQAKNALEIGYAQGDSAGGVTRNIELPTTGENEVTIAWAETSDTNNAIEISETNNADGNRVGTITRPESANAMVTLTATLTKGNAMDTRKFTLTVFPEPATDAAAVTQAKTALEIGYASGESASGVTRDVTLPTTGANGVAIAWAETSDTSNAIDISETNNADGNRTGTITRPSANAMVTLTATLTKGDATDTREFTLTVFPEPASDAAAVTQAKTALTVTYASGDSMSRVTRDVTLPTEGPDGVAVSWTSSDTDRITTAGVVNRLRHQYKQVTLTATLTKGEASDTKEFMLTVFSVFVWSRVTGGAGWDGRSAHTAVVFNGKMWVMGGNNGQNYVNDRNDVWSSSDGVTWTQTTVMGTHWSARWGHAAAVFDGKMWVMGGGRGRLSGSEDFVLLNDVWSSADGASWTRVEESRTPTAEDPHWPVRNTHAAVVFADKLWVMAGSHSNGGYRNDVWSGNREGTLWTKANTRGLIQGDPHWPIRNKCAAVVFDNKIWVMGGRQATNRKNDVWWSANGAKWIQTTVSGTHWLARSYHAAVVFDNKLWVMGGFDANHKNDIWWSADGENWTNTNASGHWSARAAHAAVVFDNKLWVIGGFDANHKNDVWVYQESSD